MNTELHKPDCIFCKIVEGTIPTTKLYENDDVLVFLDVNPLAIGHTIVIPKTHAADIFEINEELFDKVMANVKKMALVLEKALKLDGANILINNRPYGGQEILHIHTHLIPRYKGVSMKYGEHVKYEEGQRQNIAEKIISTLKNI